MSRQKYNSSSDGEKDKDDIVRQRDTIICRKI